MIGCVRLSLFKLCETWKLSCLCFFLLDTLYNNKNPAFWRHRHAYRPHPDTWSHVNVHHETTVSVFLGFIQRAFVRWRFVPILMEAHAWLRGMWGVCALVCVSLPLQGLVSVKTHGIHDVQIVCISWDSVNRLFSAIVSYAHPPHY